VLVAWMKTMRMPLDSNLKASVKRKRGTIMTDLVIIGFSVEPTAFKLRAEIAKLQKEYLTVRLR
jgi:hypothetical protein